MRVIAHSPLGATRGQSFGKGCPFLRLKISVDTHYYEVVEYLSMIVEETKVLSCVCDRCGESWTTNRPEPPKVCPRCKSRNWNETENKENDG